MRKRPIKNGSVTQRIFFLFFWNHAIFILKFSAQIKSSGLVKSRMRVSWFLASEAVAAELVFTSIMSLNSSTGELMISSVVKGIFNSIAFLSSRVKFFLSAMACFSLCWEQEKEKTLTSSEFMNSVNWKELMILVAMDFKGQSCLWYGEIPSWDLLCALWGLHREARCTCGCASRGVSFADYRTLPVRRSRRNRHCCWRRSSAAVCRMRGLTSLWWNGSSFCPQSSRHCIKFIYRWAKSVLLLDKGAFTFDVIWKGTEMETSHSQLANKNIGFTFKQNGLCSVFIQHHHIISDVISQEDQSLQTTEEIFSTSPDIFAANRNNAQLVGQRVLTWNSWDWTYHLRCRSHCLQSRPRDRQTATKRSTLTHWNPARDETDEIWNKKVE